MHHTPTRQRDSTLPFTQLQEEDSQCSCTPKKCGRFTPTPTPTRTLHARPSIRLAPSSSCPGFSAGGKTFLGRFVYSFIKWFWFHLDTRGSWYQWPVRVSQYPLSDKLYWPVRVLNILCQTSSTDLSGFSISSVRQALLTCQGFSISSVRQALLTCQGSQYPLSGKLYWPVRVLNILCQTSSTDLSGFSISSVRQALLTCQGSQYPLSDKLYWPVRVSQYPVRYGPVTCQGFSISCQICSSDLPGFLDILSDMVQWPARVSQYPVRYGPVTCQGFSISCQIWSSDLPGFLDILSDIVYWPVRVSQYPVRYGPVTCQGFSISCQIWSSDLPGFLNILSDMVQWPARVSLYPPVLQARPWKKWSFHTLSNSSSPPREDWTSPGEPPVSGGAPTWPVRGGGYVGSRLAPLPDCSPTTMCLGWRYPRPSQILPHPGNLYSTVLLRHTQPPSLPHATELMAWATEHKVHVIWGGPCHVRSGHVSKILVATLGLDFRVWLWCAAGAWPGSPAYGRPGPGWTSRLAPPAGQSARALIYIIVWLR